jgi:hypothetical protein
VYLDPNQDGHSAHPTARRAVQAIQTNPPQHEETDVASNHFIDTLPREVLALIEGDLEKVPLKRDNVLIEVESGVDYVYLPINSIISVIAVMENGDMVESRTIGREGGFGLLHALGSTISYERVIVQVSGAAFRIRLTRLRRRAASQPSAGRRSRPGRCSASDLA